MSISGRSFLLLGIALTFFTIPKSGLCTTQPFLEETEVVRRLAITTEVATDALQNSWFKMDKIAGLTGDQFIHFTEKEYTYATAGMGILKTSPKSGTAMRTEIEKQLTTAGAKNIVSVDFATVKALAGYASLTTDINKVIKEMEAKLDSGVGGRYGKVLVLIGSMFAGTVTAFY